MANHAKTLGDVSATRNGKTQTFPRLTWNLLGPNKQGWQEVKGEPKELSQIPAADADKSKGGAVNQLTAAQKDEKDAEQARKDASHAHKEVFGKYASKELTTEEILKLVSERKASIAAEDALNLESDNSGGTGSNPDEMAKKIANEQSE